ncbi:MAG TPA: hypothetical protein VFJ91_01175 [Gaiellaceae bacterium]|nr:hypothetical protein [Gaiellaceae bacterium]
MSKRIALLAAAGVAAVGLAVPAAGAQPKKKHAAKAHHVAKKPSRAYSGKMLVGINDEAVTLYGDPAQAFQAIKALRAQIVRVNLYWGGNQWAVANKKPLDATDPGDHAYRWDIYDRLARYAHTYHVQLMFSIVFSPRWANGGKAATVPPKSMKALQDFAVAAATRYDGGYVPPAWQQQPTLAGPTEPLPVVNLWTAWNEPNNPDFLTPQYTKKKGKYVIASAAAYAKICNSVYAGIHAVSIVPGAITSTTGKYLPTQEMVACGVTDPRGNDNPHRRPSVDPISFLTAAHNAGMKTFDVYAHNPYASSGKESPKYVPKGKYARRIQLGNINVLLNLVKKYYGPKHLWITEYGYQTNPPDKTVFGTSWKNQAAYLKSSILLARRNPRIDIFIWYLIKDEPKISGWQSGLETFGGKKKPAWAAFVHSPRG